MACIVMACKFNNDGRHGEIPSIGTSHDVNMLTLVLLQVGCRPRMESILRTHWDVLRIAVVIVAVVQVCTHCHVRAWRSNSS